MDNPMDLANNLGEFHGGPMDGSIMEWNSTDHVGELIIGFYSKSRDDSEDMYSSATLHRYISAHSWGRDDEEDSWKNPLTNQYHYMLHTGQKQFRINELNEMFGPT